MHFDKPEKFQSKPIITHPWQKGPTELIWYAIEHMHRETDFDRLIAYLLLDVGIETLLKTFLLLPNNQISLILGKDVQTKYYKRKEWVEGGFHSLIAGIESTCGEYLKEINLSDIQYFHDVRNKLYHQGTGINPLSSDLQSYAKLSVALLKKLLDIDIDSFLRQPQIELEIKKEEEVLQNHVNKITEKIHKSLKTLENKTELAIEKYSKDLLLPSFHEKAKSLSSQLPKVETHDEDHVYEVIDYRKIKKTDIVNVKKLLRDYIENPKHIEHLVSLGPLATLIDIDTQKFELYLTIMGMELRNDSFAGKYWWASRYPEIISDSDPQLGGINLREVQIEEGEKALQELDEVIQYLDSYVEND